MTSTAHSVVVALARKLCAAFFARSGTTWRQGRSRCTSGTQFEAIVACRMRRLEREEVAATLNTRALDECGRVDSGARRRIIVDRMCI